jgi:hypothetical protein
VFWSRLGCGGYRNWGNKWIKPADLIKFGRLFHVPSGGQKEVIFGDIGHFGLTGLKV